MTDRDSRLPLRSYLELVRLPNLFTAMADVAMGLLFVEADRQPGAGWVIGLLVAASSLLYASGVALNDVFDLEIDARERPERPLPSGRISLAAAKRLGSTLLLLGVGCGVAAAWLTEWLPMLPQVVPGPGRTILVVLLLAGSILFYDAFLKTTPLGPLGMGACRTLNVLLGMSVALGPWRAEHWLVAAAIGTYVTGLAWFARTEAEQSRRWQLALAALVIILGIALLGWLPNVVPLAQLPLDRWYLLIALLGMMICWRFVWAVIDPDPSQVQAAVGQGVLSLVMLDAVACFAVRGIPAAVVILLLLLPAGFFQQWFRAT